ncbi:MAG: hypothetical protein CMF23_03995 [Ignavibacteriae bacterium]|nr:hypothetical protein [Ignavibacteriota bacterium]
MKNIFYGIFLFLFVISVNAQVQDYEIGVSPNLRTSQGAFWDYSDETTLNIKVSIWGFVKYPGRYIVPIYTTPTDLMSYAGGPTDDAHLDELRIYRQNEDKTQTLLKFNYEDLMWEDELVTTSRQIPELLAGDVLVVPGSPRFYFKDYLQVALSILSAMISLSILIFK